MGGWNENVTVDPCLQCWRIHCSCQAPPCCRPSSRCGLTHSTGTPPRYLVWERGKSVFEGKALVLKFHCTNFKKQCTRFWIELSSRLTWIETRFWIPDSQKQIHLVLHKKKSSPGFTHSTVRSIRQVQLMIRGAEVGIIVGTVDVGDGFGSTDCPMTENFVSRFPETAVASTCISASRGSLDTWGQN